MSAAPSGAAAAIAAAASKYQVPVTVLAGIYGRESSFGTAYKPGQRTFGYFGLTSPGLWHPGMTIQQDADAAAKTLAANYHGSWDQAVLAYSGNSGNSYNAQQAQQTLGQNPGFLQSIGEAIAGLPALAKTPPDVKGPGGIAGALDAGPATVQHGAQAVAGDKAAISKILGDLSSPSTWLRVAEAIGGVLLIVIGLVQLARQAGVHLPAAPVESLVA